MQNVDMSLVIGPGKACDNRDMVDIQLTLCGSM